MGKRRVALVSLGLAMLLCLTALAAGTAVTLRSDDPVPAQAAAFQRYLSELPESDRAAWHRELERLLQEGDGAVILSLFDEPEEASGSVFIVASGKVYHGSRNCSSLSRSKNIREISLEEAQSMGRRACKVCR